MLRILMNRFDAALAGEVRIFWDVCAEDQVELLKEMIAFPSGIG
jgi:hypothetical protein